MEVKRIKVVLNGLADIMFDKFFDHSKEKRPPEQKLYLADKNKVVLPSTNIRSFLIGNKPPGCIKAMEGKGSKEYMNWCAGHVHIDPVVVPFSNGKNKEIVFDGFKDPFWIFEEGGRDAKGGKMERTQRPVLRLPWSLPFQITLIENPKVSETKLYNWFVQGGLQIGLGNGRPMFGRFQVETWSAN